MTFLASKLLWGLAAPGNFLLLVLLLGVVALAFSRRRLGLVAVVVPAIAYLATASLPVAAFVAAPLENRFPEVTAPPAHVDGIVLLGGAVDVVLSKARGQVALNDAAERVTATAALARRYPQARIVVSGGEGLVFRSGLPEADATRDLLVALGVPPERLVIEPKSRNTWENAVFSHRVAQPKPGETWLLVTSALHMPRAVGCFRRAGWSVDAYPVDYRTPPLVRYVPDLNLADGLELLNVATKEWYGLLAYYLLGRTDALFPGPAADPSQMATGSG